MRVLYVAPMTYGSNAGVDALGHGLESRLAENGIETRVIWADFRDPAWPGSSDEAVRAGADAGVDAIIVWVIDDHHPAEGSAYARSKGVPVISLERPRFPVDASVVYPNFNHGVYMAEHLATLVPPGARTAIVGGPDVVDDIELMLGLVHGVRSVGLTLVNDPEDPRYKNVSDVAEGGKEKTANILADFPELDALIPYNDETMLGAVEALREAGRLGEVTMVSRNGTPKAVELIRQGIHHGTWDLDIPGIGQTVGDLVVRHLVQGVPFDGDCVASPIGRMITPERAATWVPWEQRIAYNQLREGLDG
ncbi:sugar ABC transporter substrate-binding protein [Blastococcus sp. SYSU D00669]